MLILIKYQIKLQSLLDHIIIVKLKKAFEQIENLYFENLEIIKNDKN